MSPSRLPRSRKPRKRAKRARMERRKPRTLLNSSKCQWFQRVCQLRLRTASNNSNWQTTCGTRRSRSTRGSGNSLRCWPQGPKLQLLKRLTLSSSRTVLTTCNPQTSRHRKRRTTRHRKYRPVSRQVCGSLRCLSARTPDSRKLDHSSSTLTRSCSLAVSASSLQVASVLHSR